MNNINELNNILNDLFKTILNKKNDKKLSELLRDILDENDSKLISTDYKEKLSKYSKKSIRLLVEKNILLSIENKSLANRKSYWEVLKTRCPGISTGILCHYLDTYIGDIKKDKVLYYKTRTIDELNSVYSKKLEESFNNNLDNVISVKDSNEENSTIKGDILLDKESKIEYGKFDYKDELLNAINSIKTLSNQSKVVIKNDKVDVSDLRIIIESANQTLRTDKISKQDSSIISSENDKKVNNLFSENKGIDLPNGEYVSIEEMNSAIDKFVKDKNSRIINKPTKVISIKSKFKQVAAAAALAVSILASTFSLSHDKSSSDVINTVVETSNLLESNMKNLESNFTENLLEKTNVLTKSGNVFEVQEPIPNIVETSNEPQQVIEVNIPKIEVEQVVNPIEESEVQIEVPEIETPVEEVVDPQIEVPEVEVPVEEVIEPQIEVPEVEVPVEEVVEPQMEVPEVETPVEEVIEPQIEVPEVETPVEEVIEPQIEVPEVETPVEEVIEPQIEVPDIETPQINYEEGNEFQAKSYNIYNSDQIYQLAAIVGGEDNGTYEGALAVISTMCNRADENGSDPLSQAKSGAFSAYGGEWYNNHINGGIPDYILNATIAGLNGTRNTTARSFRGSNNSAAGRIQIGEDGNCNNYFDFLGDKVIVTYDNGEIGKTM